MRSQTTRLIVGRVNATAAPNGIKAGGVGVSFQRTGAGVYVLTFDRAPLTVLAISESGSVGFNTVTAGFGQAVTLHSRLLTTGALVDADFQFTAVMPV